MNGDDLTRREFLKRAGTGTAALGVAAALPEAAGAAPEIPRRVLGKTGVKVSLLGFGGGSQFLEAGEEQGLQMIERAVAAGISYFDTASSYGANRQSEHRYGRALPKHRKRIFLATKTGERTYDGALRSVEESLKALQTDHLDLIQMHDVGPSDDPSAWEKPTGALTALRKLRDQKVVRFVGFTGHQRAEVHRKVIESLDFDTVLMALNAAEHLPFRQSALPAAVKKKMGVIGMKTTRNLIGKGPGKAEPRELLAYVWDLPVAVTIVGMTSLNILNENIRLVQGYKPGKTDTAALAARLAPHVTAAQLGWAVPGYADARV